MKRYIAFVLAVILLIPVIAAVSTDEPTSPTRKEQLWWIINSARGNGEFSFEFELAPSPAQIEAGTHGQRGVVEGKDGLIRVFNRNADGTYTEATNSVAMALFARNFRLLTQEGHNHNQVDRDGHFAGEFPEFFLEPVGENWSFENFPLITHATLNNAADRFDINLTPANLDTDNFMLFVYDAGATGAMRGVHAIDHNGNSMFKRISNLKPELIGVSPDVLSPKTQLWWIIDSARGNGEFSFSFELEDGTTGIVSGKDGDITITPHSTDVATFTENFARLTQRSHNHNNEVDGVRPFAPPFPEWLGLTDDGVGFVNGNFELFPLITQGTLNDATNPYEMNLAPVYSVSENPEAAMLFIYDAGVMAVAYWDGVYMIISNLQNSVDDEVLYTQDVDDTIDTSDPTTSGVSAPNLNTADAWAREGIQSAFEKGFVPADLLNNYTSVITRAEFSRLAMQWLEYVRDQPIDQIVAELGLPQRMGHTFSDTTDPIILSAYRLGIVNGVTAPTATTPGVFNPSGQFDRQQAAVMLMNICRAIGTNVDNFPTAEFVDLDTAASWARDGINFVYATGVMGGTDTDTPIFSPSSTFTRQESINMFNNINYNDLPCR